MVTGPQEYISRPHRDCRPWTMKYQLKSKTTPIFGEQLFKCGLQQWSSVFIARKVIFEIIIKVNIKYFKLLLGLFI